MIRDLWTADHGEMSFSYRRSHSLTTTKSAKRFGGGMGAEGACFVVFLSHSQAATAALLESCVTYAHGAIRLQP